MKTKDQVCLEAMRVLVINSKGGSGKTTFALNVAVPLLLQKGAEVVNYIDVDIANREALNIQSEVIIPHLWVPEDLKEKRIPRWSVVDVGGNLNALQTLDILDKTEKLRRIDLVAIPLAKGEQDAYNALEVYNRLRKFSYEGPIIFVLSQVVEWKRYEKEFFEFFGFGKIQGVIEQIPEQDRNIFLMPYSNELRRVKALYGLTIYEFLNKNLPRLEEFVQKLYTLEDKLDELDPNSEEYLNATQEYELVSDLIYSIKVLSSLWQEKIKPQLEKLK